MNILATNPMTESVDPRAWMPLMDRIGPATQGSDPRALFIDTLAIADGTRDVSKAREAAEKFVANVFVEPIFKQMREMNNAAPPFAPGDAEKQFGGLMDRGLAQQIVRSSSWGLVDRIARDLGDRGQAKAAAREWSA